jgi:predicted Zn finger-like uncharacterized protein
MDVTCERCSTEYEFDDALVSERGTTVKCTNCGHQFKVRRADGGAVPERWVVRTVDGRELEFTALRDLQSAISYTRVTRDDVISRGGARPRRLGSIAELEPFFTLGIAAPTMTTPGLGIHSGPARSRTPTPVGLGVVSHPGARTEGSVAIPLPTGPRGESAVARRPAPTLDDEATQSFEGSGGILDERTRKAPETPPRPSTPSRPPSMPPVPYPGVVVSPENAPPVPAAARVPAFDTAVTRVAPGAALEGSRRSPKTTPGMPAVTRAAPGAAPEGSRRSPKTTPGMPAMVVPSPPSTAASISEAQPPPPEPHGPDSSSRMTLPVGAAGSSAVLLPPEPTSDKAPRAPDSNEVPSVDPPAVGRRPVPSMMTPTPAPLRSSRTDEIYSDPRFSGVPSKRSGGARLIVGLVVAGLVLFTGMTVGRKYLAGGPSQGTGPVADERITELLREGEKSLGEGDLETAKEQLDKASERDPRDVRVAAALARLATARADQRWLKLRLMAADDPDRESTKRELDTLAQRAKKAADAAAALAPQDPTMIRYQVDALRLLGDGDGARKLTKSMAGTSAQPEAALVLAGLDLAEDKPDWPTVHDRLRTAASGEQNLGRARSMLVYALTRSGDFAGAKAELDRLAALPRPHPLTSALRAFLARSETSGAEVPDDFREAIRLGNEARTRGDLARAERLFKAALQKSSGNKDAQTGLADVARARKETAEAIRLYQQVLRGNPDHAPALVGIADLKWEIGDRKGAIAAYKKLLQRDASGPHSERAKDRIKQGASAGSGSGVRPDDGRVPDDYVHPGTVDTSDMPGTTPPPTTATPTAPTAPTETPTATPSPPTPPESPPPVDTSDPPGSKPQ